MANKRTILYKTWRFSLIFMEVLFCLIAIVFIVYCFLNITSRDKVIKTFGFQHFVVQSESMEPVLNFGDLVICTKADDLKLGDIITFYADINHDGKKEVVTHYLATSEQDENGKWIYQTKREQTDKLDNWIVSEDNLIGKYSTHFKKVGLFILFFRSPIGIRVLILDVIIIYVLFIIINDRDEDEFLASLPEDLRMEKEKGD